MGYLKMAMTESQKKYEKKRAKTQKTYAIKYNIGEEYQIKLEEHLKANNISFNAYCKSLIENDLK